ncbi:uncharacterized protein MEPE_03697 [Melanopsichium pennsylvanicum]|uniref:Uncharacterized protein n=1 Tax=Melanopsichium pennsylvanicum TaxID=63383 RepID=A0AAJ5C5X2_9BASI|nr:uncharacterized protein MEPE_03697 [Melanopsichium pennsylvanicum]
MELVALSAPLLPSASFVPLSAPLAPLYLASTMASSHSHGCSFSNTSNLPSLALDSNRGSMPHTLLVVAQPPGLMPRPSNSLANGTLTATKCMLIAQPQIGIPWLQNALYSTQDGLLTPLANSWQDPVL